MAHFSEQPLVDYVRGVSEPEISKDIRAHETMGCSKCQAAHDTWSRVQKLATEESAYTPPENLVRLVKLGFGGKTARERSKWTLATLVFDSFAQPLTAGVRSGTLNIWQVIFEAEGLTVDLRFGRRSQSKEVHVVGQVFDKQAVRALRDNATIEVSTEKDQLIATTAVTDLGEFHLEFMAKDAKWLAVKAGGRNTVRIPLTPPA